ncbi:putative ATPase [Nonomuraea polychroma]|uniref:Putative ATPase n=2 Tax=Nonomuraea polychroma TaxID=46176 RepID=A0A438MC50_9ACTN|nr:putative ATPase [Nonomuraea polychroma]
MATPTGWRREGNLPAELTSFIGRTRLLANLKRHLGDSRLVTVTGIGGVGKSRTVLRLAHQVRAQYLDGVWFADLARLQDTGMVKHTIASALRIADQSTRAESETLSEWVGERDMLLIIDTCDRVVSGAAELVQELLEAAPNLKVLATSRQSLNLPYEQVVPVPPLQVPGEDPTETYFLNESVQLFAARAGASVPEFQLDEDNINAVAELCRRLDGIPLAIELAAVRLRALSVEQILGLLADRFSLLAGASRTALPRHQTLRAAIGWSHELCEPAERLLWARLSVFAGDFELDAARFVCSDARLPPGQITDLVTGLVEKSILLIRSSHAGVRYKLIDTLADYGDEWLDKLGEKDRMRQRHLEYYLSLAERGEDAWSGQRQIYWFVRMRQEHDNVRVALEHALKTPGKEVLALNLLSSLWFMWVCCGFAREGRLYLERALAANPDLSKERCKALWVLSYVRSAQGDSVGAREAAETCSTEAVRVGDSRAVILASKMQGTAAMLQGDLQKASALLGVAIEFNPDNKELNPGLLPAIVELSIVLTTQGEVNEAESLLQDCLQVCRERGELWLSSYAHWALSLPMLAMGRTDEALRTALEGLRIKRHFHDTVGTLMVLETVAKIYSTQGEIERASRLLGALHQNWRSSGLPMLGAPFPTTEHEKCVQECKRALGEDGYKLEFEAGAKLDLDEAVTLAQEDFDTPQGSDRNNFGS